jgi:hypothetical protein
MDLRGGKGGRLEKIAKELHKVYASPNDRWGTQHA